MKFITGTGSRAASAAQQTAMRHQQDEYRQALARILNFDVPGWRETSPVPELRTEDPAGTA